MKMIHTSYCLGLLAFCSASWILAETNSTEVGLTFQIDSVAQIAVIGDELQWAISAPTTPGGSVQLPEQTFVQYLQYTSVIDSWQATRQITVERGSNSGLMPGGILVYMIPEPNHVGTEGVGELGTIGAGIMLESGVLIGSNVLVDNIQSGWTGHGPGEGVQLNYSIDMNAVNIDELQSGLHNSIELVFTISESQ